ncbi:unnamed protein product [Effrenium voratum]|uniref:C3H1-type domain-containing protein n=1 Tax=Effrenium voratum TaxID=2562239 RepID=A0AA36MKD9_9DINO|nr:unnamed protein product [Effrenium voratum]
MDARSNESAQARATSGSSHSGLRRTKMCKFFLVNRCARGRSCTFAHSPEELRDPLDFREGKAKEHRRSSADAEKAEEPSRPELELPRDFASGIVAPFRRGSSQSDAASAGASTEEEQVAPTTSLMGASRQEERRFEEVSEFQKQLLTTPAREAVYDEATGFHIRLRNTFLNAEAPEDAERQVLRRRSRSH